jgi:hypothetical protein
MKVAISYAPVLPKTIFKRLITILTEVIKKTYRIIKHLLCKDKFRNYNRNLL